MTAEVIDVNLQNSEDSLPTVTLNFRDAERYALKSRVCTNRQEPGTSGEKSQAWGLLVPRNNYCTCNRTRAQSHSRKQLTPLLETSLEPRLLQNYEYEEKAMKSFLGKGRQFLEVVTSG